MSVKKTEDTEASAKSDPNLLLDSMGLSRPRTKDRARGEEVSPKLELLWTFKCKLITGYIPLCIEFNKENTVCNTVQNGINSIILCPNRIL